MITLFWVDCEFFLSKTYFLASLMLSFRVTHEASDLLQYSVAKIYQSWPGLGNWPLPMVGQGGWLRTKSGPGWGRSERGEKEKSEEVGKYAIGKQLSAGWNPDQHQHISSSSAWSLDKVESSRASFLTLPLGFPLLLPVNFLSTPHLC